MQHLVSKRTGGFFILPASHYGKCPNRARVKYLIVLGRDKVILAFKSLKFFLQLRPKLITRWNSINVSYFYRSSPTKTRDDSIKSPFSSNADRLQIIQTNHVDGNIHSYCSHHFTVTAFTVTDDSSPLLSRHALL